jgi:predicted phosphodiesterase
VRLGVLSDIHGNATAAEAVIADGRACGVERWWALGDLVAIGPDPVATLELLANVANLVATRGNTERYVLTRDRPSPSAADVVADPGLLELFAAVEGSFAWTRGAVTAGGWLDWLTALPLEVRVELDDGTRVLGVHATPGRDDSEGINPQRPDDDLRAACEGAAADIVVGGHTHQPTDRRVGAVRAVNGGSVSNPITDDLRPAYVIVHADRHGHGVEHRRVDYDRDAFLRRIERSGHPEGEYIRSFQRGDHVAFPAQKFALPDAAIFQLSDDGLQRVDYDDVEPVQLTRSFLDDPERFLPHLLSDD